MAKLQMLSFEDDDIIDRRIKEESNYCDVAHLYVATYGICQVILQELSPIDLDGNGRLTITANVEKQNVTPGYSKLSPDRKHRALVYNCFAQKMGDALKVEIVSTYHRILLRQLSRFHGNHESVHGSGKTSCRS